MLNKILLKKIISPLSLRGAKQQSNLKGFSLIELMVAVVILVMAIFGIFHAYSVGFMGMADARAVTVATNYAREAMEDIKNMDFGEIPTPEIESNSVTVNGITYNRQVIVQENSNIKKVITTVTWKDRNGKQKMVETDMVVHFIETTAGVPTRIVLYADPYNVIVREDEITPPADENKSIITAVIKDARGNTIISWDKEVIFLLTGSGGLSSTTISLANPITITPDKFVDGKAIITFTAGTFSEGVTTEEVTITASTEGLTPDSVTINVYDPGIPVKINLKNFLNFFSGPKEETLFMFPGSKSTIEATIVDAAGVPVPVPDIEDKMTFIVSVLGTLDNQLDFVQNSGIATIDLTSSDTAGTITIIASINVPGIGVISGVIDVITGGQIILSASPIEVPNGEKSVITVTIKDVNGLPINYEGDIDLVIIENGGGLGTLLPNPVYFDGSTSSKEVTFAATYEGTVEIIATDPNAILTSDTLTLTVIEKLTPHHIIVYGMPLSIPAGGTETSLITAKVMTEGNVKITSYTNDIIFTTTAGSFSFSDDTVKSITLINGNGNYNDGVATAELYSSDIPEIAEITVSSTVSVDPEHIITGSTEVGFYIGPDHIILSAVPQNISVGGQTCIVTVEMVDYKGTVISDYNEDIGFSISPWPNTIKFLKATTAFLTQKFKKGKTAVILKSGTIAGTAVIVAYSEDIFASLNIPVGISLELEENSIGYNFDDVESIGTVSFNIYVQGADLILEEMQVSWQIIGVPPETLESIRINGIEVYFSSVTSGTVIDIANNTTLPMGTSNVKMYFDTNMSGKSFTVIFNPNSGNYSVPITDPEIP